VLLNIPNDVLAYIVDGALGAISMDWIPTIPFCGRPVPEDVQFPPPFVLLYRPRFVPTKIVAGAFEGIATTSVGVLGRPEFNGLQDPPAFMLAKTPPPIDPA
jgi:hypothetical protein